MSDLIRFVGSCPSVPPNQRPFLLSALRSTQTLLGRGAPDVKADPKAVLRDLDRLSPAMAGIAARSLANLKSRVRRAFQIASPQLAPARQQVRLAGAWVAMEARLATPERRALSRFLRLAQTSGWSPAEISDEHLARFEAYLEDKALLGDSAEICRATARAWNRAADLVPDWPGMPLTVPPRPRRQPYWIKLEDLPRSTQQEIAAYLERLGRPSVFLEGGDEILAPKTVEQYRYAFIQLASALVRQGMPIADLDSLSVLLAPTNVSAALRYLHKRNGEKVTTMMELVAIRAFKVAGRIGMPADQVEELGRIQANVARHAPPKRCLTEKNRSLVDQMEDTAFVDRLVSLPERLMREAEAVKARHPGKAAACARDAVAIELLLTCSMRLGNLIDLRLGDSIKKMGQGEDGRWVIALPAEKVKNDQDLRFTLPDESAALLERYLARWHQHWAGPGSPWLFPGEGSDGRHLCAAHLSNSISRRTHRFVGARITAHQFRHLMAELYLRVDPNGIGVVSQHLAHRDYNTTRRFYVREQTRLATQRYHEVLRETRKGAPTRGRGRRARRDEMRPQ